jgi:hypothetical protein
MQNLKLTGIHKVAHGTGQYLGEVTIDQYGHIIMTEVCLMSLRESELNPGKPVSRIEAFTDNRIRLVGNMMIVSMSKENLADYERARALVNLPKG